MMYGGRPGGGVESAMADGELESDGRSDRSE